MPIYIDGSANISIYVGDQLQDAVFDGSDQIWPPITFPYILENTNLTDARRPEGAAGALVELIGGGGTGKNGSSMPMQNNVTAFGGEGGGAGAAIGTKGLRFFIPIEDLAELYSVIVGIAGTASSFTSGGLTLTAGAGSRTAGGTPSQTGISYARMVNGAGPGANNSAGGAAGGGQGTGQKTDSNQNVTSVPGQPGGNTLFANGGVVGNGGPAAAASTPGAGAGGNAAANGYGAGGGGGQGRVGSPGTSGRVGGPGYARVVWTDKRHVFDQFTAAGSWSWTLPSWLRNGDKIRLTGLGGGRGGDQGGSTSGGAGGRAGAWNDVELTVGVDVPVGGTLVGFVGTGGAINGGNGGNTTCTTVGFTALGATTSNGGTATAGDSAGTHAYLDDFYLGGFGGAYGGDINISNPVGGDGGPGSGGGGGGSLFFSGRNGGKGGDGRLFIHAYQV